MIVQLIIAVFTSILAAIFAWLPSVTTLPTIGGYNIDTALAQGIGMFYTYAGVVWPVWDVFLGFLFLIGYYTLKMVLKFFLGHRAPGSH